MSQRSNFKSQVMEALFNAPTNLITNKAVMWALSNLPDEGGNGEHATSVREYDHESDSFWNAIGMQSDLEVISDKFREVLFKYIKDNSDKQFSKSMVFQHIEKNLGHEGLMYLAIHGFIKHYEALQEAQSSALSEFKSGSDIDSLIQHLKEIKKRLGGEE